MSYEYKYKKYKNKYNQLKMYGGNDISNNVEIIKNKLKAIPDTEKNIHLYYVFKIKDITFFLIGEHHLQGTNVCYEIVKNMINLCNTDIDIYIEDFYNFKHYTKRDNENEEYLLNDDNIPLDNLRDYVSSRNDTCEKIKVHFTDLRNSGLMNLYNIPFIEKNKGTDYNKFIFDTIFENHKLNKNTLIKKEFRQQLIIDEDEKTNKFENVYYENFISETDGRTNLEQLKKLENSSEITDFFSNYDSYIIDPYTILRMLKIYNSKIRIGYYGSKHIKRYFNFFKTLKDYEFICSREFDNN